MSKNYVTVNIFGEELYLLPEKAVYRLSDGALILSDLHLGKSAHFRKEGIPIPAEADLENLDRLSILLETYDVKKIIVNGDLFHSFYNSFALIFLQWRKKNNVPFFLVCGNHDVMNNDFYSDADINVLKSPFVSKSFIFSHEPASIHEVSNNYAIYGHIHPGIKLHGRGKQSIRLPIFYFTEKYALLPAFGSFTGLAHIKPEKKSRVFVCLNKEVSEVNVA